MSGLRTCTSRRYNQPVQPSQSVDRRGQPGTARRQEERVYWRTLRTRLANVNRTHVRHHHAVPVKESTNHRRLITICLIQPLQERTRHAPVKLPRSYRTTSQARENPKRRRIWKDWKRCPSTTCCRGRPVLADAGASSQYLCNSSD